MKYGLSSVFLFCSIASANNLTPAQIADLSRRAKAISDEQWQSVASSQFSQKYEILKGDTLSSISTRLFGDSKYWPKLWAINNKNITNPHMLKPGRYLVFTSGSDTSLPQVQLEDKINTKSSGAERAGPTYDERTPKPSSEWKKLKRQGWESSKNELPPNVDQDGFDKDSFVIKRRNMGIELDALLACAPVESAGKILGSRDETSNFSLTDQIVVEPGAEPLEVDQFYNVVGDPETLIDLDKGDNEKEARKALVYHLNGKVQILGVHEGTYLGKMVSLKGYTSRDNILIPLVDKVKRVTPVAAEEAIEGKIIFDRTTTTYMSAQEKWVYINRGVDDGVRPGMIFRIFQYKDPLDSRKLTDTNMLVQADVQVVQSCGGYSQGLVLWSRGPINDRTNAILLTDVSDIKTRYYLNGELTPGTQRPNATEGQDAVEPKELAPEYPDESGKGEDKDWLDELDTTEEMDAETQKVLEQLEEHKEDEESVIETAPQVESQPQSTLPPPPAPDGSDTSAVSGEAVIPEVPPPPPTE